MLLNTPLYISNFKYPIVLNVSNIPLSIIKYTIKYIVPSRDGHGRAPNFTNQMSAAPRHMKPINQLEHQVELKGPNPICSKILQVLQVRSL